MVVESIPVGISASDFVPERGHIEASVYHRVEYLEYGGHFPARTDVGVQQFLQRYPHKRLGRHLVSTELPADVEIEAELSFVIEDVRDAPFDYLVTDFCFWRLGGRSLDNLWFRPLNLTPSTAERIARNALDIERGAGVPFFLENPPFVWVSPGADLSLFLRVLAEHGAKLCLDIGHFVGWCFNTSSNVDEQYEALPIEAIRMCHVAGLSHVSYREAELLVDNHNVPPPSVVMVVLQRLIHDGAPIERITYESELAPTDVQMSGLAKLGR